MTDAGTIISGIAAFAAYSCAVTAYAFSRGRALGRTETAEAIAERMVSYGMAAPMERDGVGWQ